MINAEKCKYYSYEAGRKNGKSCIKNPDNPTRCMPWLYETDCDSYENSYENNELKDKLIYEVIPDILNCKNELSEHNRSGEYGFVFDNGKRLKISFEWK